MELVTGFFDYCISEECLSNGSFDNVAKRMLDFGYHTIAINQTIEESNEELKKKKKKGETRETADLVPAPHSIKLKEEYNKLKVLNRLTITFGNQDYIHKITKSPNYKKYHIIAVCPTTHAAFQFTCGNLEADILTFNAENKPLYKLSRKLYNQLISRRYHLEILYSPAILDSTKRKNTIYQAHMCHVYGKSKNVIVSSGADNEALIRSPYDIINLGLIFGLNHHQAKESILLNGKNVYINSVGRRHGKAIMFVERIPKESEQSAEEIMDGVHNEDNDDQMETDQPVPKKSKQCNPTHV